MDGQIDLSFDPKMTEQRRDVPDHAVVVSMSDRRGVIEYANASFCDLCVMDADKLSGAPHKVVRHPDMPKAVFFYLWKRLLQGQPVLAYVKNKAADNHFYWVCALVFPKSDGFLSVRFNPRAPQFSQVQEIYADLLELERTGMKPVDSAARLVNRLQDDGYLDYSDFMRRTLADEFQLRHQSQGHSHKMSLFGSDLNALIKDLDRLIARISDGFQQIRGEPTNMRVLAGRVDGAASAISTIAQNYESMAREMQLAIAGVRAPQTGQLSHVQSVIETGVFHALAAELLAEASRQCPEGAQWNKDPQSLHKFAEESAALATRSLREIIQNCRQISKISMQLRRRINGLDVVKLLCRVESGRIGHSDQGLVGIIDRIESFHRETDSLLNEVSSKTNQILAQSNMLSQNGFSRS